MLLKHKTEDIEDITEDITLDKKKYLPTGIRELNKILSIDDTTQNPDLRGFLIGKGVSRIEMETPVILINGTTGTGKTTLALQVAFSAAKHDWITCFYSLEQSVSSLENMICNFGYFLPATNECEKIKPEVNLCDLAGTYHKISQCLETSEKPGKKIHICHLSPRPIREVDPQQVFENRYTELQHMIEEVSNEMKEKDIVFFIDSLNAFSSNPLNRNEIHRLFSLFRAYHVTAVLAMENYEDSCDSAELAYLECAKFLADIVINLTKKYPKDYMQSYLEIEKSRVGRQSLGKNLYKIRTCPNASKIDLDPRTGIVLYSSIHSTLSSAREMSKTGKPPDFLMCNEGDDLHNIIENETINAGECLTIIGPPGTHKLALGMNLAMGHLDKQIPRLLIVNFGGSGNFNFEGIAWTEDRQYCSNLKSDKDNPDHSHMKFWRTDYQYGEEGEEPKALATILTFKIGQLTPEECVYIVNKCIDDNGGKFNFSSVLLSDTAELCSGFPLLASDPLFLPALVDLFAEKKLVTVCIGVDTNMPGTNSDINFTLSSRADYRIVVSHYPEKKGLFEKIINSKINPTESKSRYLTEQLVSLVIDNVSGKHYGRIPRWLWATEEEDKDREVPKKRKVLHCEPDIPIEKFLNAI